MKSSKDTTVAPPTNTAPLDPDDMVWFNDQKNQFKVIEPPAAEADPVGN